MVSHESSSPLPSTSLALLRDASLGGRPVTLGILDGEPDLSHPCFDGASVRILPPVGGAAVSPGAIAHGTHVLSVVAGQPGTVLEGLAPATQVVVVPIYGADAEGGVLPCTQVDIARGIDLAVAHGVEIIAIAGGQAAGADAVDPLLHNALERAAAEGVVVVAAAGNDGCACVHVPAVAPHVLAVGAAGRDGTALDVSNYGAAYGRDALLAPGASILGAAAGRDDIEEQTGTSQATAVVAGVLAALCAATGATATRAREAVLASVAPCRDADGRCLGGHLDPLAAWERLEAVRMSTTPTPLRPGEHTMETNEQPITPEAPTPAPAITPSACACNAKSDDPGPQVTYALGRLGIDYATEAHRDSLVQQGLSAPHDPASVAAFLAENPSAAIAVTFTVLQQDTPIYAVRPAGPFAQPAYARLVELLGEQSKGHLERISFPGLAYGSASLSSRQSVPVLFPESRAVYAWSTTDLVKATVGPGPAPEDEEAHAVHVRRLDDIANFLERVYYDLRNLGQSPGDRALNFAATNAFQLGHIFRDAIDQGMVLAGIASERSSLSRPDSDMWDVTLEFFDPKARLDRAKSQYKFTVDVSYVVPVTVGRVRKFHSY